MREGQAKQGCCAASFKGKRSDIASRRGALAREETGRMEQRTARDGRERDPPREHERTGDEGKDWTREDRASQSRQLCRINRTHTGGQNERGNDTTASRIANTLARGTRTGKREGGYATGPQKGVERTGWSDGSENRGQSKDSTEQLKSMNL